MEVARIDHPAIDHFGHRGSAYLLLVRRVISRVAFGSGEALRAAMGRKHFPFVIRHQRKCLRSLARRLCLVDLPGRIGFLAGTARHLVAALAALILLPFLAMIVRCRSMSLGLYSVVAWNFMPCASFLACSGAGSTRALDREPPDRSQPGNIA